MSKKNEKFNSKKFFERNALKGIFGFWVKPFKNIFLFSFAVKHLFLETKFIKTITNLASWLNLNF